MYSIYKLVNIGSGGQGTCYLFSVPKKITFHSNTKYGFYVIQNHLIEVINIEEGHLDRCLCTTVQLSTFNEGFYFLTKELSL